MDSELLYLKGRSNFHRRMAWQAMCGETRCVHDAFVRAYLERIEKLLSRGRSVRAKESPVHPSSRRSLSIVAMPEHVG